MSGRAGKGPLAVVIVYAFDCTTSTAEWYKVDDVFWCVQEKLTRIVGSSLGYTYVMSTPNTYTSEMKLVDSVDTKEKGYTGSSSWKRTACMKNMASGLHEAHRLISQHGDQNGIILLFSDGLVNKGDFFDGAENIDSSVPVYTFTLGGDAYNQGLRTIAAKSSGGMFSPLPVPDNPSLSVPFSQLMDTILDGSKKYHEKNPSPTSGRWPLDVVIVSAFDCTASTPAWNKVDGEVFWLVQKKLTSFVHSCLGYTYVMSTPNTYTSEMKLVDSTETEANGYTSSSAWRRNACTNNMAAGLSEAQRMISDHGHLNGIILLFSDGLINNGNFFDGAEGFVSKVPVHTFTLGGVAYNQALRAIAGNSPGGTFNFLPVPEKPSLSVPFSRLVDRILNGTTEDGRRPLNVVIVFAFDITKATSIYAKKDHQVYWLVQKKLINFVDNCLGYIHFESKSNKYDYDMKLVDSTDKPNGYKASKAWKRTVCTKNMSAGLSVAEKMITDRGRHSDGIILLLSDGQTNAGDFFDGAENFASQVPVHTFTLGGPAYNQGLRTIAAKSQGGMFHPRPVPENPSGSAPFSLLLDRILNGTMKAGKWPLDVVIVYAFDCTTSTQNWYNMDHVFWLVQEKLAGHFTDSCLGYTYVMSTPNTCTSEMKIVDSTEIKVNGYKGSPAWQRMACTKNMASGLSEAHKLISYREHQNSIILFFSDGLINKGDYFDGAEDFPSKVPVHTFTLGGNAYNQGLLAIAENSPGGMFHPLPVPDKPNLSVPFSDLLDRILGGTA